MATVTYLGNSFECEKAFKGADFIHLLDANGVMIVAFDGVSDFSGFAITDGNWETPAADHDCYIAVIRDDGTIGKGGHRCSDIAANPIVYSETQPSDPVEGMIWLKPI